MVILYPKSLTMDMEKRAPMNKILFAVGLLIVGIVATLLLINVIELGVAAAIG